MKRRRGRRSIFTFQSQESEEEKKYFLFFQNKFFELQKIRRGSNDRLCPEDNKPAGSDRALEIMHSRRVFSKTIVLHNILTYHRGNNCIINTSVKLAIDSSTLKARFWLGICLIKKYWAMC